MGRWLAIVALLAFGAVGCSEKHRADRVIGVADDDPRMNAAIDKARSTVNTFITALRSPKAGQSAFSVKMAFADGAETEHMWLMPVSYDGQNFQGTVNNEPQMVKTVSMGQVVTIAPARISDWMYVENRKLVGGWTLRVLRDALPSDERADFDKSLPFKIE